MKKYKPGDIILFGTDKKSKNIFLKGANFFQNIFDGEAVHSEMIFEDKGKGIVDALGSNFDGVKVRTHDLSNANIAVFRLNINCDYKDIKKIMVNYFLKLKKNKNLSYDNLGLIEAAANQFMDKIMFNKYKKMNFVSRIKKIFYKKDEKFCSELTTELITIIAQTYLNRDLKLINNDIITPGDQYRLFRESNDFIMIKDFD